MDITSAANRAIDILKAGKCRWPHLAREKGFIMNKRLLFVLAFCVTAPVLPLHMCRASGKSYADLVELARAEADRVAGSPGSQLFDLLTSRDGSASLGLSEDQLDFSRRLDMLVRDALVALLLRGVDDKTPPTEEELRAASTKQAKETAGRSSPMPNRWFSRWSSQGSGRPPSQNSRPPSRTTSSWPLWPVSHDGLSADRVSRPVH